MSRVVHYSDDPSEECAQIFLQSAHAEIVAFGWNGIPRPGQCVPNRFEASAEVQAAYLEDWPEERKQACCEERLEQCGPYAYQGCGRVLSQKEGLVSACGFVFVMDDVPATECVEFSFAGLRI